MLIAVEIAACTAVAINQPKVEETTEFELWGVVSQTNQRPHSTAGRANASGENATAAACAIHVYSARTANPPSNPNVPPSTSAETSSAFQMSRSEFHKPL